MANKKRKVEIKNKELMKDTKATADYAEALEERIDILNSKLNEREEMMERMDIFKDLARTLQTHTNTLKNLTDNVSLDEDQSQALKSVVELSSLMLDRLENHNVTVHNHRDRANSEMLMHYMFSNRLLRSCIERNDPEARTRLSIIDDCSDQLFAGRGFDHASVYSAASSATRELDHLIVSTDIDIPEV